MKSPLSPASGKPIAFDPNASGKRILIMSVSAGSGHVRAAEALAEAFRKDGRVGPLVNEDVLKFTNKLFRDFYSKLYLRMVKSAPQMLGALYRASDEPWKTDTLRLPMDRFNMRSLIKFIGEFNPDITVCTHFMPAGIIAHLIESGELRTRLSIVVTDLDCHAMWLTRTFHRYFVALPETKAHLEALGLPAERIVVSGIPVSGAFLEKKDRRQLREELKLHPENPVILLSAGTFGTGPAVHVVNRLRELRSKAQVVVVCGKSADLHKQVVELVGNDPRFKVLGYCNFMHDLMKAADLLIGKPGGLTTAESLVCGLPMAVLSPIPGQEERNSDHLLEEGIAIKCNDLTTVVFKLDRLLADPERLAAMRANALRFGRPDAAETIVTTLLDDRITPYSIVAEERKAMAQIPFKT
jgi:processive 1,2-diacylglycerol beta-glucosyltransferase